MSESGAHGAHARFVGIACFAYYFLWGFLRNP
jgi:hypothetical protein